MHVSCAKMQLNFVLVHRFQSRAFPGGSTWLMFVRKMLQTCWLLPGLGHQMRSVDAAGASGLCRYVHFSYFTSADSHDSHIRIYLRAAYADATYIVMWYYVSRCLLILPWPSSEWSNYSLRILHPYEWTDSAPKEEAWVYITLVAILMCLFYGLSRR
jgi:hypothetical protein